MILLFFLRKNYQLKQRSYLMRPAIQNIDPHLGKSVFQDSKSELIRPLPRSKEVKERNKEGLRN